MIEPVHIPYLLRPLHPVWSSLSLTYTSNQIVLSPLVVILPSLTIFQWCILYRLHFVQKRFSIFSLAGKLTPLPKRSVVTQRPYIDCGEVFWFETPQVRHASERSAAQRNWQRPTRMLSWNFLTAILRQIRKRWSGFFGRSAVSELIGQQSRECWKGGSGQKRRTKSPHCPRPRLQAYQ